MHSSTPKVRDHHVAEDEGETIDGSSREPSVPPREPMARSEADDYPELVEVERRHYVIVGEIAKGGMGRVLEARDLRLGRPVAIKELLPRNRDAARRFEREARITARLQHPSIIHIYEAGVWNGGEPFFAMTRVSGRSLAQVVSERATLADRLGLLPNVIAVADALAYAHSQDVIHRDLKPGNVLVGEFGETVVIDWGLAKDLSAPADPAMSLEMRLRPEQTLSGSVVGTPAYMPPEQARGEPVDQRADVYALGALLYKVLVGKPPYDGASSKAVLQDVLDGPPVPVDEREPGAPPDLVAIVNKAMARDPHVRYPTAAELASDLKRFETGQLVAAHHYTRQQLVWRWLRRHRVAIAIAAVAIAVIAVFGTLGIQRIIAERDRVKTEQRRVEARRAALLEERGRAELQAGRAGPALANLAGAVRGPPSAALGFLIAEAKRSFEAKLAEVEAGAGGGPVIVAYHPRGTEFATASSDGRVVLWDAFGQKLREVDRGHGPVRTIAWSPDGSLLATAGDDGIARLWSAGGGSVRELAGHGGAVGDLAFSKDGKRLVTASEDHRAYIWELAGGTLLATLVGHDSPVLTVEVSPDGERVATGTASGVANVFDARTGALIWPLRAHTGAVHTVRWSPSGDRVLTASSDGTARIWDPDRGKLVVAPIRHPESPVIRDASWHRGGQRVITAASDHRAIVWALPDPPGEGELAAPAREEVTLAHSDAVIAAGFFEDRWIVTAGNDRVARVWDGHGNPVAQFEHAEGVSSVAFSPDGLTLVTGCRDGTALIWDVTQRIARDQQQLDSPVHALAIASTGMIAAGTDDSRVTVWRDALPEVLRHHRGRVFAVAFSADGRRLVTAGEDPEALVWTLGGTAAPRALATGGDAIRAVAVSRDGTIALGDDAGVVRLYSANGRLVKVTSSAGTGLTALAFDPRGHGLVGTAAGGTVHVWSPQGEPVAEPYETHNPLRALAFDASGERLVVAGVRETMILRYGHGSLTELQRLEGPTGEVAAVAFSRHREGLVFTGGADGKVRVWDGGKGKLLAIRDTQGGPIEALALSPDDALLWTGTSDGIARSWDVRVVRETSNLGDFIEHRVPWRLGDDDVVRRVEN